MMKLLKKLTLISTTAFVLCITSTTTTNFPTITLEAEDTTHSDNMEQDGTIDTETEPELQPLADDEDDKLKECPLS